jgi:hypothetical protein
MSFLVPELDNFLNHLSNLKEDQQPIWGSMNSQRMVEHLSDTLDISLGNKKYALVIPEDKVEKAQGFLRSEHPMPKNFKVDFANNETPLRNSNLKAAISEFASKWNAFDSMYSKSDKSALHPNFGELDRNLWLRCHSKHITHHFEQFGLI